ncbi:GNAT family N-acetyltransferase/peptidase C39 family protein [Halobacteriovorax sp. GB3]|uniref:GNAT family N-acetyltransferase/peptidase C39 family protein n=1 Tax=Halobacteriovorax sp. GB3 TaxID=2719615 RepID=UPI00235F4B38|nr:GNAT family N-acetyltransferase/peptidase C39 family protein [Halobacteriovorax sp. GB3]MDD0854000.1 GNAT family N-acetyltransferase/peptidase C39 family protein [Halobacteriovorax sp. GB3]
MIDPKLIFRKAKQHDLDELIRLEEMCFTGDRLSRKSFLSFIKNSKDDLIVVESDNSILGYALTLYKKGSSLARLYSIAISPNHSGLGIGKQLLDFIETCARKRKAAYMRLEVASKNLAAQGLYQKMGYYLFNIKKGYYESNDDALCFEKKLTSSPNRELRDVQYYPQTTEFTCGPSSLMMAMSTFDSTLKLSQRLELQLWREATTIFMLSGHGGCGPRGLALAAAKRGFEVDIFISTKDYLFINSVRSEKKREVMKLVQNDFDEQLKQYDVSVKTKKVSFDLVSKIIKDGGIPLVLISSYLLTGTKTPHWIVISGADDHFIYFHDPDLDEGHSSLENEHIPIRKDEFNKVCKYGSSALQSIVVLRKKGN